MKIRITPNTTYNPGHANTVLALVAPGPVALNKDGTITAMLTQSQLEEFTRRGGAAHKVEVLPDHVPAAEPAVSQVQTKPQTPDVETWVRQCRATGASDEAIVQELIRGGWPESEAREVVS